MSVNPDDKLAKKRAAQNARKRRERARKKAEATARAATFGQEKIDLTLASADRERLDRMCQLRAVVGEPYTREEYIAELIQQDETRYQAQVAALGCCGKCHSPLPDGCGDTFRGESACWRTRQYRELMV